MRLLLFLFACLAMPLLAAPSTPENVQRAFALSGVRLLCEQAAPLIQRGLPAEQQAAVGRAFEADALCGELARRVAAQLPANELQQAQSLLSSPLAQRFTEAERRVGGESAALAAYHQQLSARPPRPERLELVRQLDRQARTSELATLLRYEAGKTQALLSVQLRGQQITEQALTEQTAGQRARLQESSRQGVEVFMLFAYRQIPSAELGEYLALYQQPAVQHLLAMTVAALPEVFAGQRAQLH